MNDDYYRCSHKNSAEDTKVSQGESWRTTEQASWLRNFNPRSYAMFIILCIIVIRILRLSMAPKQSFLDSLWNASDSLWHIAFFDRTKISQMVVSRYGNCLNKFLVLIRLQLQMISDGSWLRKVVIWMQTFSAGKKIIIGLSIPHKRNNRTDVWREFQSRVALRFSLAIDTWTNRKWPEDKIMISRTFAAGKFRLQC